MRVAAVQKPCVQRCCCRAYCKWNTQLWLMRKGTTVPDLHGQGPCSAVAPVPPLLMPASGRSEIQRGASKGGE